MGLKIGEIVPRKAISFQDLKGEIIAIDASNVIYQFLSSIRQPDGTPLMDKKGRVTSHLSGLFYRNINLMLEGIKLVYVFDGKMPDLKYGTISRREEVKDVAREKYEIAREKGEIEEMGKYGKQLARLTPEIKKECIELLEAMGIPCIQAPGEAEAQAAEIARHNIFGVGSQDYDSLAFGAPRLIQNLTLARKRKIASGFLYISPEIIELENLLNTLQINLDQLICLAILAGSDYNPKGIVGIGQKKALEIVKKHKYPVQIFKSVDGLMEKQPEESQFNWQEIFELFHKPDIIKNPKVEFPKLNEHKIRDILIAHDFSEERVNSGLDKLRGEQEKKKQKTLF